jgi:hypothetical protein
VIRGNEILQYATEFRSFHGDVAERRRKTDGAIVRYVQRVDGFVSADTGNREGLLRTAAVEVTGSRLLLNLDTGALGELRVGVVDPRDGREIAGFGAADCEPIQANSIGQPVRWSGGSDLHALAGRTVNLVFRSTRTKLYSFRFE